MEMDFSLEKGVGVVEFRGSLKNDDVPEFKARFEDFLIETRDFVFDLSRLDYLDSAGLGALVSCLKKAKESDGDVKLADLSSSIRMLFEITRAYKIFDIYDSTGEAVESLAKRED